MITSAHTLRFPKLTLRCHQEEGTKEQTDQVVEVSARKNQHSCVQPPSGPVIPQTHQCDQPQNTKILLGSPRRPAQRGTTTTETHDHETNSFPIKQTDRTQHTILRKRFTDLQRVQGLPRRLWTCEAWMMVASCTFPHS